MKPKYLAALAFYVVLALMAGFTLDGVLRIAVWIVLIGLAAKTWIADAAGW